MNIWWNLAEAYRSMFAVALGDFYVYDLAMTWRDITANVSGAIPSPRESHGFYSAGGKIYLYGGANWKPGVSFLTARAAIEKVVGNVSNQIVLENFTNHLCVFQCPCSTQSLFSY